MPKYQYFKPRGGLPERLRGPSSQFHAVSVVSGKDACDGVRRLNQKRFLSDDAPQLPLSYCTANKCNCRYVHYSDRRNGEERRAEHNRRWGQMDSVLPRSRADRRCSPSPSRSEHAESPWYFLSK